MVRGLPGTGIHSRVCSQKARQKGTPIPNHPIQDYLTLFTPASHTCIGFHPQEQTMCLLQRFLSSEKPSSATLTSRSYRSRVPLAIPTPTLVPLRSLTHPASDLALQLITVPDPCISALPSSRTDTVNNWHRPKSAIKEKPLDSDLALSAVARAPPRDRYSLRPQSQYLLGVKERQDPAICLYHTHI